MAAGHEAQGQRSSVVQSATSGGRVPTATGWADRAQGASARPPLQVPPWRCHPPRPGSWEWITGAAALDGVPAAPVPSRSGSTCTCRSARPAAATATSTPTPRRSWPVRRVPDGVAGRRCAGARAGAAPSLGAAPPVATVFVGGGTPSLLPRRAPRRGARRRPDRVRAGRRRRGDHRGQPRVDRRPRSSPGCARPGSPGSRSGCSRPPRTCCACSTAGTRPGRAVEAAREARAAGLRARQPRPDLRHAGGDRRRLRRLARRGARRRVDHVSAYALIVEDGTGAGPAGEPRRAARRRTTTCSPTATSWPTTRCGGGSALVRGVELGDRDGRRGAGTTSGTGSTATGGASGPGAHCHVAGMRWWNVKHPARVRRPARGGGVPEAGREVLTDAERATERVMLRLRLAWGCRSALSTPRARAAAPPSDGLLDPAAHDGGPRRPHRRGRLLADARGARPPRRHPRSQPRLMRESARSSARVGTFAGASRHVRQRESPHR